MHPGPRDVAQVRLDNALALFDEFVRSTVKHPDAATLRGLERRFAERLQIQPSYWSQIKSRSRQIGERLARQFEHLSHKPFGWMDVPHGPGSAEGAVSATAPAVAVAPQPVESPLPQDDDERFIVGLVLTYYRRHPQRARTRLLDLLGEVLAPTPAPAVQQQPQGPLRKPAAGKQVAGKQGAPDDEPHSLWQRSQQGVAPLKRKR
ncbi:MAG TPA: hypothetical protein VHA82_15760 [Ramlibacter sp.]|uniref:hypothetical protein n=1 Tax=Ramlibacter sp. TaxID=1917967 RepID=UPI002C5AC3B3|nr:hypothetical protein [Ramlibacter sp.]HVZ45266.1 hypothetical protein [Ramlibacter sp.]